MKTILLLSTILFFATAANAQINFNQITYKGSGCPDGTASSTVTPDGSTLSVLFDEFRAEVPQYDGNNDNDDLPRGPRVRNRHTPSISLKNCHLAFTANLPQGHRVESLEISFEARGAAMLDSGVEALFAAVLVGYDGLARSRGRPTIVVQKHWRSLRGQPVDTEWIENKNAVVPLHSGCAGGRDRTIRFEVKNTIKAEIVTEDLSKSGLIMVDSNDMKGLLKFKLLTSPCGR